MPKSNVLITGSTSGIGTFLSEHFAKRGCNLFLHGRDDTKLKHLAKRVGPQATILRAELTRLDEIDGIFTKIENATDALDVIINNAFGKLESSLLESDPEDISEFVQTSLTATAIVIRRGVPLLRKSKNPHIINIAADWGFPMHNIMTGPSVYVAGKYAIHGLGAALQTELDIPVTNICPGIVAADTEFGVSPERFDSKHRGKAINPADIAAAIEFVLAAQSSQIRSIVLSPRTNTYNGL